MYHRIKAWLFTTGQNISNIWKALLCKDSYMTFLMTRNCFARTTNNYCDPSATFTCGINNENCKVPKILKKKIITIECPGMSFFDTVRNIPTTSRVSIFTFIVLWIYEIVCVFNGSLLASRKICGCGWLPVKILSIEMKWQKGVTQICSISSFRSLTQITSFVSIMFT